MESKSCPECGIDIQTCSCGEWDCAFYSHLQSCPSERGLKYKRQIEFSVAFREAGRNKDLLKVVRENYPDLFEERIKKFLF